MTLPISPYCERVFSAQNLINCQKIRLLAERLDILMLISDEGAPLKIFPFGLALRKWKAGEKAVYLLTFVYLFDYSWKMKFSVVFLLMLASFCVTTAKAGVFFNERPETDAGKDEDKLQFFQEEIQYPCKCIDGTEGYWFNNTCPKDTSQCNINPLCTLKCCSYWKEIVSIIVTVLARSIISRSFTS